MMIQAEVSFYPLETPDISGDINEFIRHLKLAGLVVEFGRMSSIVSGELSQVFDGLKEAFHQVATKRESVMIVKVSNACPLKESECDHVKKALQRKR